MIKVVVFECGRCGGIHEWETKYCNSSAVRYASVEEFCSRNNVLEEDVTMISYRRDPQWCAISIANRALTPTGSN